MKNALTSEWERTLHTVDAITDGLGKGIDRDIREVVAAFLVYKFPTSQSCQGHVSRGLPDAWIEIYAPVPIRDPQEESEDTWKEDNDFHRQRIANALKSFYSMGETSEEQRLEIRSIGIYGGFRIQEMGVSGELARFGKYLKDAFLEGKIL